jgi:erythromycin esterase
VNKIAAMKNKQQLFYIYQKLNGMPKLISILFIMFFLPSPLPAQNATNYSENNELQLLSGKLGSEYSIVGFGESTHGTREFTLIRSELIKNLVSKYNYKLLVLEADYLPCMRINEYLRTGIGSPETLLLSLRLWPWIHKDFLNLLIWLKDYNAAHQKEMVQFSGMDSQYGKIYATKDSVSKQYPEQAKEIFTILDSDVKPKQKITALKELSDKISSNDSTIDIRLHYYIFCYINKLSQSSVRDPNSRDENMADLFQLIRKRNGNSIKTIIWSHNGHISKQGPSLNERTAFGSHIIKKYGKEYAAVGLDFREGQFLAVDYNNSKERNIITFTLSPTKKTLASEFDFSNKNLVVVDCKNMGTNYINAIGAIYEHNPDQQAAYYSKIRKDKEYDFLILSYSSTPIILLEGYLNKQ